MVDDVSRVLRKMQENVKIELSLLSSLLQAVEARQEAYKRAGGSHAAGIFDVQGSLLSFSEDVGRHNALDKAIGKVLLARRASEASVAILSSRLSYEMVQKRPAWA